jgi:predicted metal-dependent HD superfamily phosphohydrolase
MSREPSFSISDVDLRFLRKDWEELAHLYHADQVVIDKWFDRLVRLYSQRGRAYHNLSHIRSLAVIADSVKKDIQDYSCLKFALWFHDAIYRTRRRDNEERSAELASESLVQLGIPSDSISIVREMILATKQHRADGAAGDLKIFLDLDLSILGSEEDIYKSYAQAIRREYWWVPAPVYRKARIDVLKGFLNRESIYYTKKIAERFGLQAKHNIESELEALVKGTRK